MPLLVINHINFLNPLTNMKTRFVNTLFILGTLSTFIQCQKDDTPVEILQNNKWQITSWIANPAVDVNGTKLTELSGIIQACSKDDVVLFKSDKTIVSDEGATKCKPTDPQSEPGGKWDLSSDAKNLYLTDTNLSGLTGTVQGTVNKLDDSELNVTLNKINFVGSVINLTLTLKPL